MMFGMARWWCLSKLSADTKQTIEMGGLKFYNMLIVRCCLLEIYSYSNKFNFFSKCSFCSKFGRLHRCCRDIRRLRRGCLTKANPMLSCLFNDAPSKTVAPSSTISCLIASLRFRALWCGRCHTFPPVLLCSHFGTNPVQPLLMLSFIILKVLISNCRLILTISRLSDNRGVLVFYGSATW